MLTEVKIDGLDISSHLLSWKIDESFGDQVKEATLKCSFNIYIDLPTLDNGNTVSIKRGIAAATEQFKLDGYVDTVIKQGATVTIKCKGKLVDLIRASVQYTYDIGIDPSAGVGSEIAKNLIEQWGGMTADVVSTGSTILIKKFICNGTDVLSRIKVLADIYDYQLYFDPSDQKVYFKPKGYVFNPNTIYVGGASNNALNVPKWEYDNTQCVNRIIVKSYFFRSYYFLSNRINYYYLCFHSIIC